MLQDRLPEFVMPWYDILSRVKRLAGDKNYPLTVATENFTPFFIIGSGRCGTTLLRRMLDANETVHIPPETYVLGEVGRLYMRNRQMDWKYLVNTVAAVFEYSPEFERFGIHMAPLVHKLWQLPESQRSLAAILNAFYLYHAEQNQKQCLVWGDKTPQNTFELSVISRVFPNARYIHLLRDGVDVAASYVTRGLRSSLEEAALLWQDAVVTSRKFMQAHPRQCLEIRYEDLARDPEPQLQQICDMIGISFHRSMIETVAHTEKMGDLQAYEHYNKVLQPVSASNIGLGRRQLSEQEQLAITRLIGTTLKEFGYEA